MTALRLRLKLTISFWLAVGTALSLTHAADDTTNRLYQQMVDKAVAFLTTKSQADDGSFNAAAGPAVTAGGVFADLLRVCAYLGAKL